MRLIDADALIEAMKKTETEYENAMTCPSWWSAFNVINEQPTAYDVDFRNKAIDEFVTMICKHYTEEESKCNYKQYCAEIKQNIADIAEQLKARRDENAGIYR